MNAPAGTPGQRARSIREASGVTRDVMARQLGVSLRTLARWENGEGIAPARLPQQVADAVGRDEPKPDLGQFTMLELVEELERRLQLYGEPPDGRRNP